MDAQTEWNYHCWQGRRTQMDMQICHSAHITQMCHILIWKVSWNIPTVARKEFRSGHCLWCAVSSTPAADMAPALLNLNSVITDALQGLAGDSCTLIHNSSWVKLAEKAIIFGVMYTWKKTQPMIRFFPGRSFPLCGLQTSAWEIRTEIFFLPHPITPFHVVYSGYGVNKKSFSDPLLSTVSTRTWYSKTSVIINT